MHNDLDAKRRLVEPQSEFTGLLQLVFFGIKLLQRLFTVKFPTVFKMRRHRVNVVLVSIDIFNSVICRCLSFIVEVSAIMH